MLDRSVEYLLFRIVEISCPSRGSDCRIILVYELVFQLSIKSESCFLVFGRKNLRSRCVWKRQLRKKLRRSPYSEICRWLTALRSKSLQPLACVFSCCASNTGNKSLFFHAASIVWRFCQVTSEKRCWVINKQARWRQRSANDHERRVTCVPGMMARGGRAGRFHFFSYHHWCVLFDTWLVAHKNGEDFTCCFARWFCCRAADAKKQGCGAGVVRTRRFLDGVGFLMTLGVGVVFFVRLRMSIGSFFTSHS